jgi:hypothetical protein
MIGILSTHTLFDHLDKTTKSHREPQLKLAIGSKQKVILLLNSSLYMQNANTIRQGRHP